MKSLPFYLPLGFGLIVVLTLFALASAARYDRKFGSFLLGLTIVQSLLSMAGFYTHFAGVPPRMLALVLPPLLTLIGALATARGRAFLDSLNPATLTLMHTLRLPVELVLWGLAAWGVAPRLITFEGINFDIFSGMTAPLVWYFGYVKKALPRAVLLAWNIACLLLLANVVCHAFLSAPTVLQRYSFAQPLVAIGYFPFTLLPGLVVPAVLLAHVVCLRRLLWPVKTGRHSLA
ncbi:hypothetical protein EPD60_12890 [Flaviaesturariibacter flavus]|uniref:Uncharacterized protein n=1 Tax=Flaviaesturariibacter flavus TaxID=2502780 RepID=A0A4R1B579_9BACT|nr:hypothetical protein [Flaviaesturariibacter flavus]TCJ13284.1 hypothetical protein EPD60_12890 [Flaviaesturariibacter flavus]